MQQWKRAAPLSLVALPLRSRPVIRMCENGPLDRNLGKLRSKPVSVGRAHLDGVHTMLRRPETTNTLNIRFIFISTLIVTDRSCVEVPIQIVRLNTAVKIVVV